MAACGFCVSNPPGEAVEKDIAVAPVLGRVHGQHAAGAKAVHDVFHGVGSEPVVGLDELEVADQGGNLLELVGHGLAHEVHAFDEVLARSVVDTVVVHPIDLVVVVLAFLAAGDHMDLMATPLQPSSQLRDMNA
jgi:hypothetical protein